MVKTIGIIGGNGAMGTWFSRFFKQAGFKVLISDLDTSLSNQALVRQSDCVILSTPISVAMDLCGTLGPLFEPGQFLMDFCSQKEDIVTAMVESCRCDVVGTHPMFGPFTDTIDGQNLILCPGRGTRALTWARDLFTGMGACVTEMNAADHDRHMALVQGLTHLVAMAMARTLQKLNLHPRDVFSFSTPIFRINSDIMGRLFAQDADLYTTLVGENRYVDNVLSLFLQSLEEGNEALVKGSHQQGVEFIRDIREFFSDYTDEALDRSNQFLNIILEGRNFQVPVTENKGNGKDPGVTTRIS